MRRYPFLYLCLLASPVLFAQTANAVLIRGLVKDSTKQEALAYVTISVQTIAKDSALKSVLNKEDGSFELWVTKDSAMLPVLATVGYEEKKIAVTLTDTIANIGTILLSTSISQLGGVVVRTTATRPLIKQEAEQWLRCTGGPGKQN